MLRRVLFLVLLGLMLLLWALVGLTIWNREALETPAYDPQVTERERED